MTDQERHDEHAQYDGGSAAASEQTYGGQPAGAPSAAPGATEGQGAPAQWPESGQAPQQAYPPQAPGYPQPGYQQPGYQQPGYQQPAGYGQPAYAQPGAPTPRPAYGPGQPYGGDVLAAGPSQPKRRTGAIVTSIVVVVALIVGASVLVVKLRGDKTASTAGQAATWAPQNSVFYADVNLNPAESVKKASLEFAGHFPSVPKVSDPDQLVDALFESSGGQASDRYKNDIKPWLGDHVAVDVFLDAHQTPQSIAIVQVKDASKAKTSLKQLMADSKASSSDDFIASSDSLDGNFTAYSLQDGYAILGESQDLVDEAVAAAKKANLSANKTFSSDIATLRGDQLVTSWWDLDTTLKAVEASDSSALGIAPMLGIGTQHLGRLVMDLQVESNAVQVQGRLLGGTTTKAMKQGKAGQALGELPGGTVAGFSVANPEDLIKQELATMQGGMLGGGLQSEMQQFGAELGISLPGDVENLLGSELTVGLDALPQDQLGAAGELMTVITHPDNVTKALGTAKILAHVASASGQLAVTASQHGSSIVLTNDDNPGSGTLGSDQAFKTALDGMPSQTVAAGYLNLAALIASDTSGDVPPDAKSLQGLGFYAGLDSTSPTFVLRLTVK